MVEEVVGSLLGIEMPAIAVSTRGAAAVAHAVDVAPWTVQQGRIDKVFAGAGGHRGRRGRWDVDPGRHVVEGGHVEGSWMFEPRRLGACEGGGSEAVGKRALASPEVVGEGNRVQKASFPIPTKALVVVVEGVDLFGEIHVENRRASSVPQVLKIGGYGSSGSRAPNVPAREGLQVVGHECFIVGIVIAIEAEVGRVRIGSLVGSNTTGGRHVACGLVRDW